MNDPDKKANQSHIWKEKTEKSHAYLVYGAHDGASLLCKSSDALHDSQRIVTIQASRWLIQKQQTWWNKLC